ncbi:hypothetical protein [Veronia pacifica]|uniref:Uncharacterized protein n=1 Tax=Veronia pacifica TaxID=1080227 RepID=A0A1C3ECZ1_9GAMM|nr:hypothetical protein [Veronia pacifica]ODA31108.1 hypothetical protein A8L45_18200 [Veronia pacifica]
MSFVQSKPPLSASALSTPGAMSETKQHPEGARGAGYLGGMDENNDKFHRAPDDDRTRKVVWNPVTRKYVVVVMPEDYRETDELSTDDEEITAKQEHQGQEDTDQDDSEDDDLDEVDLDDDDDFDETEFYDEEDIEFKNISAGGNPHPRLRRY